MARPTVLLAEDHPDNAALLGDLLQTCFDVVGVVGDGLTLVSEARRLVPDVIVSDVGMPGLDGIEAARRILARTPDARVVLVSAHCDADIVARSLAAGALDYVAKHAAGEQLLPAIQAALSGERRESRAAPAGEAGPKPT